MARGTVWWRWLVLLALLLPGIILSLQVSVDDNALDLLPDGPVKGDLHLLQRLGLVDRIFITLSVENADEKSIADLKKSVTRLGGRLRENNYFSLVMDRLEPGYEGRLYMMLSPWLPVLLDENDLASVGKKISPEALDKVMEQLFVLLNSPAGIAVKTQVRSDPLGLTGLLLGKLDHLRSEFSMRIVDGFFISQDSRNALVLTESVFSLTDSKNGERIKAELDAILKKSLVSGVKVHIIGTLPHTLANSRTIKHDLKMLLPLATVLLLLLLGMTLRDIRVIPVLGVVFMAALPAIAVTSLVFGRISGLALGFGIVLLGIGVDFSIHLFLGLTGEGDSNEQLQALKRPILFAWLTTASVLAVLLFSGVPSHRQMATLALVGVSLSVLFAWLVIPVIVRGKKIKQSCKKEGDKLFSVKLPPFLEKVWLVLWGLLLISGLLAWPRLHYNGDLRVLDAPDSRVAEAETYFSEVWGSKGDQAFLVSSGETLEMALENNSILYDFLKDHDIGPFQSLAPLLPGKTVQKRNAAGWRRFWHEKRPGFDRTFLDIAARYGFSESAFLPFFRTLERDPGILTPEKLEKSPFRSMMASMVRSPLQGKAEQKGGFLVVTTVSLHENDMQALAGWAGKNPHVSLLANNLWRTEVEQSLKKDMLTLCLGAGLIIIFLVAVQFRRLNGVLAVLAPVLSALSAMSVFCFFTGVELNMMHLIMGIMVIGLSVDYGIFVVCAGTGKKHETTAKAVSICAASSLIGFGVLALAAHPALHALGVTVLVGIGAAWPAALFVSPSLLAYGEQEAWGMSGDEK
jgi:predicted exporter